MLKHAFTQKGPPSTRPDSSLFHAFVFLIFCLAPSTLFAGETTSMAFPEPARLLLFLAAVGLLLLLWAFLLKRQVAQRTRSLQEEIEERKRIEADLKSSEAHLIETNYYLNVVMEGTTDAIFIKDMKGRYLLANAATCAAIGKPRHEIIGKSDRELFPAESAEVIYDVDSRVTEGRETIAAEERLATAYGDTCWLTNKSPLLNSAGEVLGLIGISRNITEKKIAEQEQAKLKDRLMHAQKMEAIGTLAGGIAHDFNNILGVILGYADMARNDVAPGSTISHDLEKILQAANRATELVQQILAFSRKTATEQIIFQPASIIKEGLKMLRSSLPTTIAMEEYIDPNCGVISADPTQLHQVLMNLCTNAFHAMEETGGELRIALRNSVLQPEAFPDEPDFQGGEFVELTVCDTGSGIAPEYRDKIFEPYFTTKGIGKGTGMGLAIVHGIVTAYGGKISFESIPGEGTTFRVYFPVHGDKIVPEAVPDASIPTGTERILFIDDEDSLLHVGKDLLEKLGYTVTTRTSSREALELFQRRPDYFDLVITDQAMPEIAGSDLAAEMLRIRPNIPIILCTGYSSVISREKALAIGIKEFVFKPVLKNHFARLIREVLDGKDG